MRQRAFPVAMALALMSAAALVASSQGETETAVPAAPRTPWGAPDLQGIWSSKTQTPLERPAEYAEREFLTDEEVAALEQRALDDRGRDVRAESGSLLDVADAYNNIWSSTYGRTVVRTKRTSLIVDPARRPAAAADARRAGGAWMPSGSSGRSTAACRRSARAGRATTRRIGPRTAAAG